MSDNFTLETGDILLFKSNSLYSKLISWFTKSKYTHVAIALSEHLIIEANFRVSINPVINCKNYDVFRIKGGLSEIQKLRMYKFLIKQNKKIYDFLQIIGYIIMALFGGYNKLNSPHYVICSELADIAYNFIDYDIRKDIKLGDVTPADIAKSKLLIKVCDRTC